MGTLYLVRHGQASLGADDYDELSDLGWRQGVRLGRHFAARGLRFDAILTGTQRRHLQTLEALLEGMGDTAAPLAWDGLNEYDSDAVIHAVHPGPRARPVTDEARKTHFRLLREGLAAWMAGNARPEGMPDYPTFVAGVTGALDHVRTHHVGHRVLAVSSGGPISTAVGHVLGVSPQAAIELNLRMRNTSVTEFAVTPRRLALVSFNAVPHLEDPAWQEAVTYA